MTNKPKCGYCGEIVPQTWGSINRAAKLGKPIYCNRTCAGLARRSGKTTGQKTEEKRLYDDDYRATSPTLKARKAASFQKSYDPIKAATARKIRAPYHAEYCRQPAYRAAKVTYDQQHRAKKLYGEFWQAFIHLMNIKKEVLERGDKVEIAVINGTLNKKQTRRRTYERFNSDNP